MSQYNVNDTTLTKIFVGGLAWETQRDTMRRYFEEFGEIVEAVVITDKNTGRSKGYGFVTFKDAEAAMRACQNPSPVIDGRRANCNLASLGANNKNPPPLPLLGAGGRFRASSPAYHASSSSTIFRQPSGQNTFPYSPYGYSGYSLDPMYSMNYYSVYGGQQFSPYYPSNLYPFYSQYAQSSQNHGFGIQFPQMVQFPNFVHEQHHYASTSQGILSFPSSMPLPTPTTSSEASRVQPTKVGTSASSQASIASASEQNSSST